MHEDSRGNLHYLAWERGCMTASQKRVLLTHWIGEAWHKLTTSPTYHKVLRRAFETGGCNMAVPGQPLLVKILGMEGATDFGDLDKPWVDTAFANYHYSRAPNFVFSDKAGDEKDEE